MTLRIAPCFIDEAREFVLRYHRHHKIFVGAICAVAVAENDLVRGVAVIGRPVASELQDGWTVEITRCCTDGVRNGCSMLYGACKRIAIALGYKRIVTYTLKTESGASLRASGFRVVADVRGRSWNSPSRPRVDKNPLQDKFRWEVEPLL